MAMAGATAAERGLRGLAAGWYERLHGCGENTFPDDVEEYDSARVLLAHDAAEGRLRRACGFERLLAMALVAAAGLAVALHVPRADHGEEAPAVAQLDVEEDAVRVPYGIAELLMDKGFSWCHDGDADCERFDLLDSGIATGVLSGKWSATDHHEVTIYRPELGDVVLLFNCQRTGFINKYGNHERGYMEGHCFTSPDCADAPVDVESAGCMHSEVVGRRFAWCEDGHHKSAEFLLEKDGSTRGVFDGKRWHVSGAHTVDIEEGDGRHVTTILFNCHRSGFFASGGQRGFTEGLGVMSPDEAKAPTSQRPPKACPIVPFFDMVEGADCGLVGRFPILDKCACAAAAKALNLVATDPREVSSIHQSRWSGCFLDAGPPQELLLNLGHEGEPMAHVRGQTGLRSLCSIWPGRCVTGPDKTRTSTGSPETTPEPTAEPAAVPTGGPEASPTLFCWCVMDSHSDELSLMRTQAQRSVSIFGCDAWSVFSDVATWLFSPMQKDTVALPAPPSSTGPTPEHPDSQLLLNVPRFAPVWEKIIESKIFQKYDWTVKVDPDSVFLPGRLRAALAVKEYDHINALYIQNCEKFKSMQGPLEVLSRGAVQRLVDGGWADCQTYDKEGAEDLWMMKCMEVLRVPYARDFELLSDKYCGAELGDGQLPKCDQFGVAVFHPFKSVSAYIACLDTATG